MVDGGSNLRPPECEAAMLANILRPPRQPTAATVAKKADEAFTFEHAQTKHCMQQRVIHIVVP
jgi:hypothetical protein